MAGSGRWSAGTADLTDTAAGETSAGITYEYNGTTRTVTAVIASVAPGASGYLTFNFTVDAATGAGYLYNQAGVSYVDGLANTITGTTNKVPFLVQTAAGVTITPPAAVASASQGAEVTFINVVENTGNKADTFDITVDTAGSTFPAGTTYVLYKSDGVTPLLDTNQSGIPDTGLLAVGGTYNVVLKAILPASATGGGAYSVDKVARSANDPTVTDTATDTLTTITGSTVDLTNDNTIAGGGTGVGAGPGAAPVTTVAVNPGATATFVLYVNNTSAVSDAYLLQASTDPTFATVALPAGWTVTFLNDSDTAITNTGLISTGTAQRVRAQVTVPASALAGNNDIYFRVSSPTTGAADRKWDRVTVNTIRSIAINPNSTGQVFPGGSVVYPVTVRNTGNVVEGNATASTTTLGLVDGTTGFTSVTYWDRDNNGVLDPTDPVVTSLASLTGGTNGASTAAGLDPGEAATLFVKVYAPSGATAGTVDTTTVTAATTQGTYGVGAPADASATTTTTVISGDLTLEKYQALDANADGTPEGAWVTTNLTTGAVPGACIRYRLVVTNTGTADAVNVVVTDSTPSYTLYDNGDGNANSANGHAVMTLDGTTFTEITHPADGTVGTLTANVGTLAPGKSVTIYFGVKIRQ